MAGEPWAYVAISQGMEHEVCDETPAGWLDRITGELDGWLLAIAIGLGMLDLTVLVAKGMPPLPWPPVATRAQVPTQPVAQPSASQTLNFES